MFENLFLNEGNENEVQRLLMNGANLNATDENGNSALLLAAAKGYNIITYKLHIHTKTHHQINSLNVVQVPKIW